MVSTKKAKRKRTENGRVAKALRAMTPLKAGDVQPLVTVSPLSAFQPPPRVHHGMEVRGERLSKAMKAVKAGEVQPLVTVSPLSATSACGKGGEWQLAVGLLCTKALAQLERNILSYKSVASAWEKG